MRDVNLGPFGNALLDVFLPPLCHVCRKFIPRAGRLHLCRSCREAIATIPRPYCPFCGLPFRGAGNDHPCGACLKDVPSFDAARAAFAHSGAGRNLIHSFKYSNKTHLRRPLGLLVVEQLTGFIDERKPDLIVPVPLHARRLAERGYNQAVLLGELLAKEWHLPLLRRGMRRIRWTEPQINLAADQRRVNVRGAFAVADAVRLSGKRVLLVDDVFTTGSTVEECSKVLKKAGAAAVLVVTVSRALD